VAAVPVLFILLAAITSPFIRDQSHSYSGVSQNGNSSYQIDVGEKDTFALLDRASIPDWERDSNPDNNSAIASVIASLENQARGYDPDSYEGKALITQLTTMVENYVNSAQQQYVSGGKAELITPGAYTVAGYFDKDGEPIDPRGGDMDWCQITYSKS